MDEWTNWKSYWTRCMHQWSHTLYYYIFTIVAYYVYMLCSFYAMYIKFFKNMVFLEFYIQGQTSKVFLKFCSSFDWTKPPRTCFCLVVESFVTSSTSYQWDKGWETPGHGGRSASQVDTAVYGLHINEMIHIFLYNRTKLRYIHWKQ